MNRKFQKEIYVKKQEINTGLNHLRKTKQRIKNRNKCFKIRRKSIKRYMDKVSEKGI